MSSYVNTRLGLISRFRELKSLYSFRDIEGHVKDVLKQARDIEAKLEDLSGRSIKGSAILEIGAGQRLTQLIYFNTRARAIGIDTDIVPDIFRVSDYVRMWRVNGSLRTFKTVARKALSVDDRIHRELKRQLGANIRSHPDVLQMDACSMSFPDNTFDFVYSRAVFEHILDPRAALREIRRVLKPGGVVVIFLHLYTSDTGCHDARIFAGRREQIPYWAHLRPKYRHLIRENTELNRLRLPEWNDIFESELPGVLVRGHNDSDPLTRAALPAIRATGELSSYSAE